jgi:hypothetical protein
MADGHGWVRKDSFLQNLEQIGTERESQYVPSNLTSQIRPFVAVVVFWTDFRSGTKRMDSLCIILVRSTLPSEKVQTAEISDRIGSHP